MHYKHILLLTAYMNEKSAKKTLAVAIYKSPSSGEKRKIIVVDGLAYYQSTGISGTKDAWFPFIMVRGTKDHNALQLDFPGCNHYPVLFRKSYMIKYRPTQEPKLKSSFYHHNRLNKHTLIIASRLNPGFYSRTDLEKASLSEEEIIEANNPLPIQTNNLEVIEDPDKVNTWLIEQGAEIVAGVLGIDDDAIPDYFVAKLQSCIDYYQERLTLFGSEGLEEKKNLYASIKHIFQDALQNYHNRTDSRNDARRICIDNIAQAVNALETSLEINEHRIVTKFFNMLKAFAAAFCCTRITLEQPEQFKVSDSLNILFQNKRTQTVADLLEITDAQALADRLINKELT